MNPGGRDPIDHARGALAAAVRGFAQCRADGQLPRGRTDQPDDWSLADEALHFLEMLIARLQPRVVLELGSGISTCVLGRACAALEPPSTVVALESDPRYAAQTRAHLAADGLAEIATVVGAPIVARRCHGRIVPVYLADASNGPDGAATPASLVLVDGPPLPLGGREGALYQAVHASRPGSVIVLDDSRRDSERDLLVRILRTFAGRVEAADLLGFPKGLAVLLVTAPIEPGDFDPQLIPGGETRT